MSAVDVVDVGRAPQARVSPRFLLSELKIIFGRRRNLAGMAILAVVPMIIAIATRLSGAQSSDFIRAITGNGLFVAFAALTAEMPLFLPLAVSAISGDAIAGEANLGTLRCLLTIPVGRTRLLITKYWAIVIFACAATALVALVGAVMGLALFGGGDMTTLSGTSVSFGSSVLRLILISGYLAVGFSALGALGLFISTLTEQPIGATIAVLVINVLMFICNSITQLEWLHPWLLTHWWFAFGDLLRDPMYTDNVQRGLLTAALYVAVFWLAAWARFSTKDVSS
jgi:ABC-2 type transport system permease protein